MPTHSSADKAVKQLAQSDKWLARLSALSERSRVRVIRLLELEELGVGELARALSMPQSTVSRHLKLLHELGLIAKRTDGTASLYRLAIDGQYVHGEERMLWRATANRIAADDDARDDEERLTQVLLERAKGAGGFFGNLGGAWQAIRQELFGHGFTDDALLGMLPSDWVVADLGCGTGDVAERLAPLVRQVYAVDREASMLEAATRRLAGRENVEFIHAELAALPLASSSCDAAVLMLVLHHIREPVEVLSEMARILRPGVHALIVDMVEHNNVKLAQEMGHCHFGFSESALSELATAAGLKLVSWRRLRPTVDGRGPALFGAIFKKTEQ